VAGSLNWKRRVKPLLYMMSMGIKAGIKPEVIEN